MSTKAPPTRAIALLTAYRLDPDIGPRWYIQIRDDGAIKRQLYVDIETYQDLGEPETITVTIEPGDTLN